MRAREASTAEARRAGGLACARLLVICSLFALRGALGQQSDLTFTKTASTNEAVPGDVLTYSISVHYTGSVRLVNAQVHDTVPTNTIYVPGSVNDGGSYSAGASLVTWKLGTNTAPLWGLSPYGALKSVTNAPIGDTYIKQDDPDNNDGANQELKLKPDADKVERGLIQFDLSNVPEFAVVNGGILRTYITANKAGQFANVHRVTRSWTEMGATWNTYDGVNPWTVAGGAFDPTVEGTFEMDPNDATKSTSISNLVAGWVEGTYPNNGILLDPTGVTGETKIGSRSNGTAAKQPRLIISYTEVTRVTLNASPFVVTSNGLITLTMQVRTPESAPAVDVTPPASLVVVTNGNILGVLTAGPSPAGPVTFPAGGWTTNFTYVYQATAGTNVGSLVFAGQPSSSVPAVTFVPAVSESVIALPVLRYDVQIDPSLGSDTVQITNTATLVDEDEFAPPDAAESTTAVTWLPRADLVLTKSVDEPGPDEGQLITYEVTVTNDGPYDVGGVDITDLLPTGVTYSAHATSQGTYSNATGLWIVGGLTDGQGAWLQLQATVDVGTSGQFITNTATVTAASRGDPDTSNNRAEQIIAAATADLSLTKTVSDSSPDFKDTVTFTIVVSNTGPSRATSVQVTDLPPIFDIYVQEHIPSQGAYDTGSGVWDVGTILKDATAQLILNCRLRGYGVAVNMAQITASDQVDPDSTPDNNDPTEDDQDSATISISNTFEAGSCIIDMGVTPQTYSNALAPYGMIYDIVVNYEIPVYWAIDPGKAKDGVDFTVGSQSYSGGPFIIPAESMLIVDSILAIWTNRGVVISCPTNSFSAPIYDVVSSFPNAVLDEANGDLLLDAFYDLSYVPPSSYRIGSYADLSPCDDIYGMPHADPHSWDPDVQSNFNAWVSNGGFLFGACHAVSSLEADSALGFVGANFLSETALLDWGSHADTTGPPYSYASNIWDHPLMQFMGLVDDALQGGSEDIYVPDTNGWRSTTTIAVWAPDHTDVPANSPGPAAAVAYGRAYGDPSAGMVLYEASHTFHANGEDQNTAAGRMYGNLLLLAGIEYRPNILMPMNIPLEIEGSDQVTVSAQVVGGSPPFTYHWSSSCGGTFEDMAAATTTFHAPQSTSEFECVISLRVADACGRQNVVMQTTTIVPTQPPQIGKTQDLQYLLPGEIVTYSLDVNYTGVVGLINGRVIDPIPEYTTYVSNSVNAGGMYNAASNRVTWEIGSNTGAVEGIVRESSTHTNELNPWMDVTIDQADPTVNFDSVDELHTDPNATQQERVLMRWGLWEIPGGADIHRADLRLYIETARVNHTNEFHWLTRRWTEDDVTWNTFDGATAWTTPGGDFDAQVEASFLPDTVGARTISVSNLVQNWIDGVWPNYGLIMDGQGVDSPAVYSSKEHATELQRPLLTVEYTIASNITVNTLSAQPLIITSNGQITVTMDVNVPGVHTNVDVTPPVALGVVSNNLGGLTLLSGPTPSGPVTLTAGGQTNFTWKYDVTAGDMPGYVGFYGTPTSSVTFAEAGTDLTLVLPVFSFQVQVVTNLPDHITAIYNQAYLSDDNTFSQPVVVESPEVEVYIPRLESYQDDYSTIENLYRRDPDDTGQGDDTIYVGGNGFDSNATYYVVYYDAAGDFVYTDTNAFTVGTNRFLKSYYANTNDSIDYGTWTAVAMPEGTTPDPVLRDHS